MEQQEASTLGKAKQELDWLEHKSIFHTKIADHDHMY